MRDGAAIGYTHGSGGGRPSSLEGIAHVSAGAHHQGEATTEEAWRETAKLWDGWGEDEPAATGE